MKNQPLIYGLLGFVSGAILVILIGFIVMGGMMGRRGGIIHDWFRGRCENYYPRQFLGN